MVRDFRSTSKQKLGAGGAEPRLSQMYLTNIDDIDDFRAHIFCLQKTEEIPKKHNEAGPPEQLPTDALSQIDYRHTIHCEDCLCQRTMQRAFWHY